MRVSKIQKMNQTQTTDVPNLFIGMDVHKKSWTVHFKTDLFEEIQNYLTFQQIVPSKGPTDYYYYPKLGIRLIKKIWIL